MSYFPGLNAEQISALTDEQVTAVVNLECARNGIRIFFEDESEPKCEISPDGEFFMVGDWIFGKLEDAQRVCELANSLPRFKSSYAWYAPSFGDHATPDEGKVEVKNVRLFTEERKQELQAEIKVHKDRLEEWRRSREVRQDAFSKKSKIVDAVWNEVMNARDEIRETQRLDSLFERYVEVASGDRLQALRCDCDMALVKAIRLVIEALERGRK